MPTGLDLALSGLFGGLLSVVGVIILKRVFPASWLFDRRKGQKRFPLPLAYWVIFLPLLFVIIFGLETLRPTVHKWFSAPVVATLPDGPMLTGKWWIDPDGTGHVRISNGELTCSETYNGRSDNMYVSASSQCSDGLTYDLRVIRYGTSHWKDRGEGVWRHENRLGWYVFGWKARLAILTGGWLGLPTRAPTDSDFQDMRA